MKKHFSLLGAAAGILMVVVDFLLPGGGKGSTPFAVFATGILIYVPNIGGKLAMVAPPILWGFYCGWPGTLKEAPVRYGVTAVLLGLHLGPGIYACQNVPGYSLRYLSQANQLAYAILVAAIVLVLMPVMSGRTGLETNVDYTQRAR